MLASFVFLLRWSPSHKAIYNRRRSWVDEADRQKKPMNRVNSASLISKIATLLNPTIVADCSWFSYTDNASQKQIFVRVLKRGQIWSESPDHEKTASECAIA